MTRRARGSLLGGAIRGAIAGVAATWLMDLVTTGLLEGQSEQVNEREKAAQPNGKGSVENLVDRLEASMGVTLDDRQLAMVTQTIHYALGAVPGAMYGALRGRLPLVSAGQGLLYGLVLFAVNDEFVNTTLGLAGPYEAYPIETHWRGLVGHAVLGSATDTLIEVLGG